MRDTLGWIGVVLLALLGGIFILTTVMDHKQEASSPPDKFDDYMWSCEEQTKSRLKYPSSFDASMMQLAQAHELYEKDHRHIAIKFTAKNAFGTEIEGSTYCDVRGGAATFSFITMEDGTVIR